MRASTLTTIVLCLVTWITSSCSQQPEEKKEVVAAQPKIKRTPKPTPPPPYRTSDMLIQGWEVAFTISSTRAPKEAALYDEIISELEQDPSLRLMIIGHTCAIGFDYKNEKLGKERAKAIYDKLIALGVSSDRLEYKSAGEHLPVSQNDTEEGREENRRVSFERI
ncbi:OmpA family protein [Algivirga pacifica]|uniref:OmpA-like domain-containing protein n=1 Tax=Algivirga pacifica TaxID=1162670 RepID=A0ABP9D655_9BACT